MLRKMLFILVASFMFMGVVSAASQWGSYKGFAIVKAFVSGKEFKTKSTPPIVVNGQPMVPLSLLKTAGVPYTYDAKKLTVNVNKAAVPADPLKGVLRTLGDVSFSMVGGETTAYVYFVRIDDEDRDWEMIDGKFMQLAKLNADRIEVRYIDEDGSELGTISIDRSTYNDFLNGKLADISELWTVTGNLFKPVLTSKEIGKLQNAVGVVLTYDEDGELLAQGSGFVIDDDVFVTNYHVVEGASQIIVRLNGTDYDITDWYYFEDEEADLYGVRLSTKYSVNGDPIGSSPEYSLDYNTAIPAIGEKVYAIGSPQGFENTLSEGIVSSIRAYDGMTYIQHTADIDHGSSGGVLLNEKGDVIGVTSMGVDGTLLEFAIPIKYVVQELNRLSSR
ncbi:S1C family serine protease [Cohnella panacarvi]|uniref:S1C family serine protease n=1 Tax=Cohnella panacarvi TaxID=400776 RepID=UPI0004798ECA|nr:S1C family serine protease [Cohnella panacarvi]